MGEKLIKLMNHEKTITKKKLILALEKLEKEDKQLLKQFDKLDNRTNAFLSISLGVFSLQITLLTGNIINICEKYILQEHNLLVIIILLFFIANIIFNIESIVNFRRSSKISEKLNINTEKIKLFTEGHVKEWNLLKEEILFYYENIEKNETKINYKKKYINRGLNNIIISMSILISIIIILFIIMGKNVVII